MQPRRYGRSIAHNDEHNPGMMMAAPNTVESEVDTAALQVRYSSVAIVLHWALALLLAFQLALGWAMPDGPSGFDEYQLHKSVGILILLLTLARLGWRMGHRPPPPVERGWEGFLAKAVHTGFYVFLIATPLSGWIIVSASSIPVPTVLFGTVPWPHLPVSAAMEDPAERAHELLALFGVLLFLLHVIGALRHHFLLKDGLLRRMGPGGSAALAGVLAALVVIVYFATGMRVASNAVASGGYETAGPPSEADRQRVAEESPTASETPLVEESPAASLEDEAAEAEEEGATAEAGPPPVWTIQPGGRLGFAVAGGGMNARGTFSDWSGTIRFDPEKPESADIRIEVRLASASLGDETQDSMLQSGDFFASAANPTATWRSTSVRQTAPNRYSASGTLSLRGVSRPQSLTFTLAGDGLRRRVEGSGSIDRTAFGVGTGDTAASIDRNVSLTFAFDAVGRAP